MQLLHPAWFQFPADVYELVLEYFGDRKDTGECQLHSGTRFLWATGHDSSVTWMLLLELVELFLKVFVMLKLRLHLGVISCH